jgi:uncharacterized protein YyaL (SSP411 family)
MDNEHGQPLPPEALAEQETTRVESVRRELIAYAEQKSLRSLEDRVRRGLNSAAVFALSETRAVVEKTARKIGADLKKPNKLLLRCNKTALGDLPTSLKKPKIRQSN